MGIVLLTARLILAVVFGVAGLAKFNDRHGSRRALTSFGVPQQFATPLAWALPISEVAVALALLPRFTAWWGVVFALALLLVFTVAITRSLMHGQSPDCRCFGQLHAAPVTRTTLLRNLGLAVVAGLIVAFGKADPGPGAFDWLRGLRPAEAAGLVCGLILAATFVALAIFIRRLLKRQAELLGEVAALRAALADDGEPLSVLRQDVLPPQEGLPIGVAAPPFMLATLAGERVSLAGLLRAGRPVLLIFAGADCWGCKVLLPVVRRWQREYGDRLTVAVLSGATREETEARMAVYEIDHLLLDEDLQVADDYQARWTPAAVLVSGDGRISSHVSYGDNAIREWLRNQIASGALPSDAGDGVTRHVPQVTTRYAVCEIGEPAPRFSLLDLSGERVQTADLLGSPTVLFFWHPRCAYCAAMRDDLRSWEDQAAGERPKLVFVAAGELDDIRAINRQFKSLTLMDPAFDMAPMFGTKFTPSAILIDGEGRVASSLAIGEGNVRALIGLPKPEMSTVAAS
jgi:peroxiredoxin/uncharacterized membrane protein YphA (DoxX/SURF4 family)